MLQIEDCFVQNNKTTFNCLTTLLRRIPKSCDPILSLQLVIWQILGELLSIELNKNVVLTEFSSGVFKN